MAEYNKEKKYWIQLKRDFFKRHDMMILESQPNGKEYELFYLKLMLESIDHNGELRFSETIPYNESMLSAITNTNIDIVRTACKILHELGMIDILSDGTLYLHEVKKLLNYTTVGAEKKQLQLQKKEEGWTKGGKNSTTITNTNTITNTITNRECDMHTHVCEESSEFLNTIPTLEEIQEFIILKNYTNVDAQRFKDYFDSVGWKRGNTPITNWQPLVGMWEREQIKQDGLKAKEKPKYKNEFTQLLYEEGYEVD